MIGVHVTEDDRHSASEFFEVFKTPWEFWQPGGVYDVVIVATAEMPPVDARLLIVAAAPPGGGLASGAVTAGGALTSPIGELQAFGRVIDFPGRMPLLARSGNGAAVAFAADIGACRVIRLGLELFKEVAFLLEVGQAREYARIPTLDRYIKIVRRWIVEAGITLIEIPPVPAGHACIACLTHDVDFAGIRRHGFDHSVQGFLYRATLGSVRRFLRGRLSFGGVLRNWAAALALPLVHLRLLPDRWMPFDRYRRVEKPARSTYFLLPFKGRLGERVTLPHPERRAAAYDVADIGPAVAACVAEGNEVALHGIDAWLDERKAGCERDRIASVTRAPCSGVRMHWLCFDPHAFVALDRAGFDYDSTCGYNDEVGYRSGTSQAFRPLFARHLLELPLHMQDVAMFRPDGLDLTEAEAWRIYQGFVEHACAEGGALTLLWHGRSLEPERLWGRIYARILTDLRERRVWLATARAAVRWFRKRRAVTIAGVRWEAGRMVVDIHGFPGPDGTPGLLLRVHLPGAPSRWIDVTVVGNGPLVVPIDSNGALAPGAAA